MVVSEIYFNNFVSLIYNHAQTKQLRKAVSQRYKVYSALTPEECVMSYFDKVDALLSYRVAAQECCLGVCLFGFVFHEMRFFFVDWLEHSDCVDDFCIRRHYFSH